MILTAEKSSEVADRIRDMVEVALAERNLSARRASIDVVGHDGLIRDIRAGRIPSADRIEALFTYLGLEVYFGPKRAAPTAPVVAANQGPDDDAPSGFLTIPWAEMTLGTGSAPVSFSRAWLDEQDLKVDFLKAAKPDRVEVEGVPADNTLAVLDTRPGQRGGHGLWCYRGGGQVVVAHITFADGITIIHPARPERAPQVLDQKTSGSLTMLGKVVWLGQSVPLKGTVR